ncbi:Rpn family recombination-promoting nuclease/putative transposase [Prevotella sp.]|uniref:Rpn family recombination-promoting nuclease/putative transposase n=1 Tax=Prevotella sp. TaxID=59823 RepID=UPI0030774524
MGKYINPFTDWGFKRLFGQEFSKGLLISFLNDLLVGELQVKNVVFKDKEELPSTKDQRGIIYDVYCETDTGERFILEMQNRWQPNFLDRSICYACRSVLEQVDKGKTERQDAYKFLPIYTVCFMNYKSENEELDKFRTDIILADKDSGKLVSNKLRFIYLVLPLFEKKVDECDTDFDKWIYVLKHMEALSRMPFTAQKEIFKQLEEYADSHRLTKKEWEAYENSLWIARDNMACMAAAEIAAKEKGMAEGRAEGRAVGREEGREEGRAAGMAEEKIATAKRLLAMGLNTSQVAQGAGLSMEEVEKLL